MIRRYAADLVATTAVFLAALMLGQGYLSANPSRSLFDWETGPAVMLACGGGFRMPDSPGEPLRQFFARSRPEITCGDVDTAKGNPPLAVALSERYSLYGAAAFLRGGGLSWASLDWYLASLFAVTMALAYAIFRSIGGHIVLALIGVAALMWSDQVLELASLRDFGKAPGFLAAGLAICWIVRRGLVKRSLLIPAVAAGAVVGLGIGSRIDLLIAVPAVIAAILFAAPGFTAAARREKAIATGAFVLSFLTLGLPILSSLGSGTNSGHVVTLGMMREFTRNLGLEPPLYDIGDSYEDSFGYALIASHAKAVRHVASPADYGTPGYDTDGLGLLADTASLFPADLLTRALGATAQIMRRPFDGASRGDYLRVAPFRDSSFFRTIGLARSAALKLVEGFSLWMIGAVIVGLWLVKPRIGIVATAAILYFCGYSMLQFSRRHTFHLDIIPIALYGVALGWLAATARSVAQRGWRSAIAFSPRHVRLLAGPLTAIAVIAAGLVATRAWQQQHVTAMLEATLSGSWQPLALTPAHLMSRVEKDSWRWQQELRAYPGRWDDGVLFDLPDAAATTLDDRRGTKLGYLRIELRGTCDSTVVPLALSYSTRGSAFYRPYTRFVDVPVVPGQPTHLLTPVFAHDGGQSFDGIAVPGPQVGCVAAIARSTAIEQVRFPLLLAVVPPDWRDRYWYQRLADEPQYTSAGEITAAEWQRRIASGDRMPAENRRW